MVLLLLSVTALAADRGIEYTIHSMKMLEYATGAEYPAIPEAQFLVEVEVTNDCSGEIDAVMVVQYGHDGQMLNLQYIYSDIDIGETTVFGTMVDNTAGNIGCIKAFVVPKVGNMIPLANSMTIGDGVEVEPDPTPDPEPTPEPEPVPGVYSTAVKAGTIFEDMGLEQTTMATVIRNGEQQADFQLKKGVTTKIGGNGVLIEAVVDAEMNVTLYITDTYLAQVDDITGREVDFSVFLNSGDVLTIANYVTDMELAEGQYVLVTMEDDEIMTVVPAIEVRGMVDAIGAASTYTILDGVKYNHSFNLNQTDGSPVYDPKFNTEMILLLDKYGYMIGLMPAPTVEVLDGYVLVTGSEFESGGLASTDKALVEVLHLDGTGYEVLNLQTKRTGSNSYRVTRFLNPYGDWENLTETAMIPYGFYGYTMTENGEIILKALSNTKAAEIQTLAGSIAADGISQNFEFTGATADLVIDSNTALHLVSSKACETYVGYKNFRIDADGVDALIVYKGRTVQEIYVINGKLLEDDIVAYYNGGETQIRDGETYLPLYVNGEKEYYSYPGPSIVWTEVGSALEKLPEGAYVVEKEGDTLTRMTLLKSETHTRFVTVAKDNYFYEQNSEVNITYADDVEIYDLTDDGTPVDAVAVNDQVLYINKGDKGANVATYIWILSHGDAVIEPEEPDAGETEVLDGYVLVTDSECQGGGLASSDKALVEVMHLDGTGYEVFNLQTRRTTVDGQTVTQYKTPEGYWTVIDCDMSDMIPYGFYGYTMTETGEIVLKALSNTKATDIEIISGRIAADGKSQNIDFTGAMVDLVVDSNTTLHLVSSKGSETYVGYKNFRIDADGVDALITYKGRTVQEIYVINGKLLEDDIVAYYNGGESEIRGGKEYIPLYVDGEKRYYRYPGSDIVMDEMGNMQTLADGAYIVELEGEMLTRMTLILSERDRDDIVTTVKSEYFNTEAESHVTYADGVQIYDLTNGGAPVDAVAKDDRVLYITYGDKGANVATYIWILKHNASATVVAPDWVAPSAIAVFSKTGDNGWQVDLSGLAPYSDIEIRAYAILNGIHGLHSTYSFTTEYEETFICADVCSFDGTMYFEVIVNGECILTTDTYVFVK